MVGILCIIDMQPTFLAAKSKKLIQTIVKEVKSSLEKKEHILIVEYFEQGKTCKEILAAVKEYNKVSFIMKKKNDGSKQIMNYLSNFSEISKETIRICGVNTFLCVRSTAISLAKKMPNSKIVLLENACGHNDSYGDYNGASITYWLMLVRIYDPHVLPSNIISRKRRQIDLE